MPSLDFINPYPWMSRPEARVHLWLEEHHIPFSWRYFDVPSMAPTLQFLMPDFHPEFTLSQYKTVIVTLGTYFSTLPGVLDRTSLGQAMLEEDGWKVVQLWENDIEANVGDAILREMPELRAPAHTGPPVAHPFAFPTYLIRRRAFAAANNMRRKKFFDPEARWEGRTDAGSRRRRGRKRWTRA